MGLWLFGRIFLGSLCVYLREAASDLAVFINGLAVYLAVYNVAESTFLRANVLYWVIFVWGYVTVLPCVRFAQQNGRGVEVSGFKAEGR
jgi:hypothetical protein